jgi:hypothetical protein
MGVHEGVSTVPDDVDPNWPPPPPAPDDQPADPSQPIFPTTASPTQPAYAADYPQQQPWAAPTQQWVDPTQQWVDPTQQWVGPTEQWVGPQQQWGTPQQAWSAPQEVWSEPPRLDWSRPYPQPKRPGWQHPGVIAGVVASFVVVVAVAVAAIVLTRPDSDTSTTVAEEPTVSSSPTRSAQTRTPGAAPPAGPSDLTIAEYIQQNGITETPIAQNDPGAPSIDLPLPPGFEDLGERTPEWALGGMMSSDPAFGSDPATVMAIYSKLTGPIDTDTILELAPNELYDLPGFEGGAGQDSTLSGFPAYQMGGTYMRDGIKRAIAQKTVVIPGMDGMYVLQLNADGTVDQRAALETATTVIDEQTVITR